ncbi:MAG: hypothetical protein WC644_12450 [Ignavibacteria bacterium]
MAIIKRSLLGKFSGSAGDMVFCIRNGKRYFRSKPSPRDPNKPKSRKTKDNESGFAYTSSFTKEISENKYLKFIWKNSDLFGENYYGRIFSANRSKTPSTGLTPNNIISPPNIYMKTNALIWDDDYFSLEYSFDSNPEKVFTLPYQAVSIVYLYDPRNPKKDTAFDFLSFEELISEQFNHKPNTVTFKFTDENKKLLSEFKKGIIYISFIANYPDPQNILWTSTDAVEINLLQ